MHGWHLLGGISGSKRVGLTLDSERGGGSFIVSTRVWSWGRGGGPLSRLTPALMMCVMQARLPGMRVSDAG